MITTDVKFRFTLINVAEGNIIVPISSFSLSIRGGEEVLYFTAGGVYEIQAGNTIVGHLSSVTAMVVSVTLTSGAWADEDAAGKFIIKNKSGSFIAEDLYVGANPSCATIAGDSQPVGTSAMQVVVPDFFIWLDDINDRASSSDMKIEKSINGEAYAELLTVDMETIRLDEGAKNKSITLTGHRTFTPTPSPSPVTIEGYDYIRIGEATQKGIYCDIANDVVAGDEIQVGDELEWQQMIEFTAGVVSIYAGPDKVSMQVSEANYG